LDEQPATVNSGSGEEAAVQQGLFVVVRYLIISQMGI
jgi:hypothetical protein